MAADGSTHGSAYGPELSEIYDFAYRGRGKDFAKEAAAVAAVVLARKPDATSLLDVACGTGEHLMLLRATFGHVEGLDLSTHMCRVARQKLPSVAIHVGDMQCFELGRTFDAVCCLFSSISYMSSTAALDAAVRQMARHLGAGGVLVLDPLWFPDQFLDGYVAADVVRGTTRSVARVSHSGRTGTGVRHQVYYVVADRGGIRHFVDVQNLTLFTHDEYLAAIERAGCAAEYLTDGGLSGRGLFIGVRRQPCLRVTRSRGPR